MTEATIERAKSKRGFASMSVERRREIASMGGKSIPAENRAFSRQRDLASKAGRKGGCESGRRRGREPGVIEASELANHIAKSDDGLEIGDPGAAARPGTPLASWFRRF